MSKLSKILADLESDNYIKVDSLEDYKNSISNKIISEQSLKKLEKVESDFFKELILKVKEEKKAGYQELILNKMIEDIKNNF